MLWGRRPSRWLLRVHAYEGLELDQDGLSRRAHDAVERFRLLE